MPMSFALKDNVDFAKINRDFLQISALSCLVLIVKLYSEIRESKMNYMNQAKIIMLCKE